MKITFDAKEMVATKELAEVVTNSFLAEDSSKDDVLNSIHEFFEEGYKSGAIKVSVSVKGLTLDMKSELVVELYEKYGEYIPLIVSQAKALFMACSAMANCMNKIVSKHDAE